MALINTTTTGIQGSTFYADGTGDLTIQQNGQTINKITAAPAFSVYPNADQTGLTSSTLTKVAFINELFDTNNNFDNATNYRFTPTIAGYYQFNFCAYVTASNIASMEPFIYKNGSAFSSGQYIVAASGTTAAILTVSNILYLNGSTDYVEFYVFATTTAGTYTIKNGAQYTYASGALIRAA